MLAKRKAEPKAITGGGAFYLKVQGLGSHSISLLFGVSRLGSHQGHLAMGLRVLSGGESAGRMAAATQLGRSLHRAFQASVPAALLKLPASGLQ